MRSVSRFIGALSDAAGNLAAVATLILTLMVAGGVIARRVFNTPFLFVEELSGYLVLAIVFLGLAYTMKADGHIRIEFGIECLKGPARRALEAACLVAALAWSLLVVAGTAHLELEYYTQQIRSFAYLQVLLWIPGALMVVGAALLALQCLGLLFRAGED